MKTIRIALLVLLTCLPAVSYAQGTVNELETDFGARISIAANKKIAPGLHLILGGEARMSDDFSNFGRYQAEAGLTYKINSMFKVGAGYMFIEKKNSSMEWKIRHRFYADGKITLESGDWQFSLKERLQLTHRDVNNAFQSNPNLVELKSRFKIAYRGFSSITPYTYVEVRNVFNDPACSATWSTVSQAYDNYSFLGYTDAYVNRLRGSLGAEWKLSKQHSLDFFLLGDYCYDKNIDTNAKGTKLKSLTWDRAFNVGVGIGYQFHF